MLLTDGAHDWPVEVWGEHLDFARQAVGEWGYVLALVRLDDLDEERWQHFMNLCAERQLTPILRLATFHNSAGGWTAPPQDAEGGYQTVAEQYADLVRELTWPSEEHLIIVGNEPNHGSEWGGRPDPAAYARFLIAVADAIHAADPQAQILNAGFDPYTPHTGDQPFNDGHYYMDEETFLDEMVAAYPDVFSRLDVWASHSYPQGPFAVGPWQQSYQVDWLNGATNPEHREPPAGVYNRGVNGYAWELWKLSTYSVPPLPVFITETGWRHAEAVEPTSPDNGRLLPQAETIGQFMDLALRGNQGRYPELPDSGWTPWLTDSRVKAVVFFALDGHPDHWSHTNLLQLDQEGQVIGAYDSFGVLEKLAE